MSDEDREQLEWLRTRDFPTWRSQQASSIRRPRSAAPNAAHRPREVRLPDEAGACPDERGQTMGLASKVTVAGITSTVHGLHTEGPVGPENGLQHGSVVNVADIQSIRQMDLGRHVGYLFPRGEPALTAAAAASFAPDL